MIRLILILSLASLACAFSAIPATIGQQAENTPFPRNFSLENAPETPIPTCFTVSAAVAVNLRPSPSTENYPITALPNGAKLEDKGGRSGDWAFVKWGEYQGWVWMEYVKEC